MLAAYWTLVALLKGNLELRKTQTTTQKINHNNKLPLYQKHTKFWLSSQVINRNKVYDFRT